jgi:hypothetical protein
MKVKLDGDWERLSGSVWDGRKEGKVELTLYQTTGRQLGDLTRMQILCWLPETAYELNLVFPTTDWSEALSIFRRLDEGTAIMGELMAAALTDALGAEAVARLMDDEPA